MEGTVEGKKSCVITHWEQIITPKQHCRRLELKRKEERQGGGRDATLYEMKRNEPTQYAMPLSST